MTERKTTAEQLHPASFLAACLLLLFLPGAVEAGIFGKMFGGGSQALATMGDTQVTEAQVREHHLSLQPAARRLLAEDAATLDAFARAEALRQYVMAQSRREGLAARPDIVTRMERSADLVLYKAYMRTLTTPAADYPNNALVEQVYTKNRNRFIKSGQVRLRQVFLAKPGSSVEAGSIQARAAEIASSLQQADSAAFERAVELHSEHRDSLADGGDLGWLAIDTLLPEVRLAIRGMGEGEVRGPIRSQAGWHILRLEGIRPGHYLPMEEVRAELVDKIREQRTRELEREYLKRLVANQKVRFENQGLLRKVLRGNGRKYDDVPVASMGGAQVPLTEVVALVAALDRERVAPLLEDESKLQQMLANLAARGYVLREARLKGFHQRAEVAAGMARARLQSQYASYVGHHVTPADAYPDEATMRAFYRENSRRFQRPASYRLAQIFVAETGSESQESPQAARARDLLRQARQKGVDFATLAAKHSEHAASAAKGGDIGWTSRDKLVPEIAANIGVARPGDVVGPVRTAQGWHVIKLLEARPSQVRTFAEVRDAIRKALRQQKARTDEKRFLQELVDKHPISVDEARLAKLRASL